MIFMRRKQAASKEENLSREDTAVMFENHANVLSATDTHKKVLRSKSTRLELSECAKTIRRKIELLDQRIDLPVARRALGILEGEHSSHRRFGTGDIIDIHTWQPGDEARMMNWSASARTGQPMVSSRERTSSSHTWIVCDASLNMNAACKLKETLYEVASNAACFFASLSLKRNDTVSLICCDGKNKIKVPDSRNLSDFERSLDSAILRARKNNRNTDSLIDAMQRISDDNGLIVLITDEYALQAHYTESLQKIAQKHKLVVVTISPINPCSESLDIPIIDGITLRRIPAFLQNKSVKQEIEARRTVQNSAFNDMLLGSKSILINGASSEEIFRIAAKTVSSATYLKASTLQEDVKQ